MAEVLRWAREEAGAAMVRLFVMATNNRAAAFYRRIGFVLHRCHHCLPAESSLVEHEMEYQANTCPIRFRRDSIATERHGRTFGSASGCFAVRVGVTCRAGLVWVCRASARAV
jgi:hypothetical protein